MSNPAPAEVPIEAVKSYWDARPCNIRHSTAPVGTREYFDQVEARKYFVEPHIPRFAEFERWKGKKVLEVENPIAHASTDSPTSRAISARSAALAGSRFAPRSPIT